MDKIGDDRTKGKGPEAIKTFLALKGFQIPRSVIREVMEVNNPAGAQTRTPSTKVKLPCKNLTAQQGVFQELHCNGHEKLSSAALMMGPGSGIVVDLRAVPDAWHLMVVGHVYFDLILEYGAMPIQLTFDKGSETGDMYAAHVALREIYTPDLDPLKFPPVVALKSTNNIPIENLWKWLRQISGQALHYWNYHKSRLNSKKMLLSGVAPLQIFCNSEEYGLTRMSVPVKTEVVEGLREGSACTREEAFWWVLEEFDQAARNVYEILKSPKLEPSRGWEIFGKMLPALEKLINSDEKHRITAEFCKRNRWGPVVSASYDNTTPITKICAEFRRKIKILSANLVKIQNSESQGSEKSFAAWMKQPSLVELAPTELTTHFLQNLRHLPIQTHLCITDAQPIIAHPAPTAGIKAGEVLAFSCPTNTEESIHSVCSGSLLQVQV
ncbi:hypothetical protein C8R43DRAFT_941758 [Mycena crocata]|nr:hypothetical protein C8R43DRAFT_941758 [Mycena crocata]